jgi:hypothetical protein
MRMCIDFIDLNRIHSLIDVVATLELMSLLDYYLGYH